MFPVLVLLLLILLLLQGPVAFLKEGAELVLRQLLLLLHPTLTRQEYSLLRWGPGALQQALLFTALLHRLQSRHNCSLCIHCHKQQRTALHM
jgi:hypothetical protein